MELNLEGCSDRLDATCQFAHWCEQLGYDVRLHESGKFFVLNSRFKWNGDVKADTLGNHRVVFSSLWSAKKFDKTPRSEWVLQMNILNDDQNYFKFSFDDDGIMTVQVYLVFLGKLHPRLLRNFLATSDAYLEHLFQEHNDFFQDKL